MDYMIFRLIDKSKEKAILSLVDEKGLTKKDIILILRTLEFNPNIPVDGTLYENLNYAQNCGIITDESNLLTQMVRDAYKIADKYDVARINVLHDIAKSFNNALEKRGDTDG